MLERIEHVAVAVANLEAAVTTFADVWGLEVAHRERIEGHGVEEAMLPLGDSLLQLIAPTSARSTVARFLERRGEGLHHIAIEVSDITAALARLRAKGVEVIDDEPRPGGRGHLVAFVHPRTSHGLLIELVQRAERPPERT